MAEEVVRLKLGPKSEGPLVKLQGSNPLVVSGKAQTSVHLSPTWHSVSLFSKLAVVGGAASILFGGGALGAALLVGGGGIGLRAVKAHTENLVAGKTGRWITTQSGQKIFIFEKGGK